MASQRREGCPRGHLVGVPTETRSFQEGRFVPPAVPLLLQSHLSGRQAFRASPLPPTQLSCPHPHPPRQGSRSYCSPPVRRAGESSQPAGRRSKRPAACHQAGTPASPSPIHLAGLPGVGGGRFQKGGVGSRTNVPGNPHQAHMAKTTGQPLTLSVEATPSPPSISRQTV